MPLNRLSFKDALPHPALRSWIRCYYQLESLPGEVRRREGQMVPDGHLELGFNLGGESLELRDSVWCKRLPICVDDVLERSRRIRWDGPIKYVAVKFRHEAGLGLLGLRASDCENQPLDATTLSLGRIGELSEKLASSDSWEVLTASLDEFFFARVSVPEPDRLVAAGSVSIRSSAGSLSIELLSQSLGVSRRLLEQRVKTLTGLTPKRLAQIVRTREAIRRISDQPEQSLGMMAISLGFCDQSHFIREFKSIAGYSPTRFFATDQFVSDLFERSAGH